MTTEVEKAYINLLARRSPSRWLGCFSEGDIDAVCEELNCEREIVQQALWWHDTEDLISDSGVDYALSQVLHRIVRKVALQQECKSCQS